MNITDIKQQLKNSDRYSIFVDDKYSFSLSTNALLESGVKNGQALNEADLASYKKLSSDDKAYGLTLAYIGRRMRSEGELVNYFRRKGYDDEFAGTVLSKLRRLGLVDDEEFARRWVDSRRSLKSSSAKKIRLELRQKKVSDDVITKVLDADETDERTMLRELIVKKRRQTRYQDDQRLIAYLARQGFSYDDIKSAL